MKKLSLFYVILALVAISCNKNELIEKEVQRPDVPGKQSSITIEGDSMITTRATTGRVEFTGGYATGAGLYSGESDAIVEAVPYSGYQLVSFSGGPTGGNSSQFNGKNSYSFNINSQDWKFSVTFKQEYKITISAGTGGTVSGGGTIVEGSNCTIVATPNQNYSFEGWYEGSTKVSSSANYIFTVSSNRTSHI